MQKEQHFNLKEGAGAAADMISQILKWFRTRIICVEKQKRKIEVGKYISPLDSAYYNKDKDNWYGN